MSQKPLTPRSRSDGSKRSPTAGSSRSASTRSASNRSASTRTPSTRSTRKTAVPPQPAPTIPLPPKPPSFWRTLLEDPDALRNIRQRLPAWVDELIALLLIGLGAVAFAALLSNSAEAGLSSTTAKFLKQGFGDGAYVVSLAIAICGIIILLPKLGFMMQITLGRVVALELAFIALQGLLHATRFEKENLALAREGQGGGYVGWAMSSILSSLLGERITIALLGLLLLLSLHWLVGLRRQHYRQVVGWFSHQMQGLAVRIDPEITDPPAETAPPIPTVAIEPILVQSESPPAPAMPEAVPVAMPQLVPTTPAARRPASHRGRSGNISTRTEAPPTPKPPMVQPAIAPVPQLTTDEVAPRVERPKPILAPAAELTPMVTETAAMEADEELIEEIPPTSSDERPALVLNGQVIESSLLGRERPSIVPRNGNGEGDKPKPAVMAATKLDKHKGGRDDNPNKRYFTVADFADRKKIGKRNELLPPFELLHSYDMNKPDEEEINRNASIIENTLLEFDIDADVIDVKVGPVVTQYAVSPIKQVFNHETGQWDINRIRVDRITSLQGDLSLALSAKTLRIEAPVPGHSYVGIEVPNKKPSLVGLRPALESENFYKKQSDPLAVPLGRDVSGEVICIKLASLPHMLVAGTTGSGKSVFLTAMVTSLIMNYTPDQMKLVMLDPKRVELTRFNGLPHLIGPVETEADRIIGVLRWLTREMDRRYKLMELENARNIEAYNAALGRRRKDEHFPYMVMVFDEIGDLMMSHPDETEGTVTRLAQKARAAGIHLVIATQRPSTEIITGLIKANFPARMSFAVATGVDSRVILDYTGAETLLGKGDMLYLSPDASGPQRIQGCYVSDEELDEVVMYWKNWHEEQIAEGKLERQRTPPWERGMTRLESLSEQDVLLEQAIALVCESKEASTSMIQRRLGVGYPRAAHLMDMLYELGVIGPPKSGGQPRTVLITNYKQALNKMRDKNR